MEPAPGAGLPQQWFAPGPEVRTLADEITRHAVYVEVVVAEKAHKRGAVALHWTGYQLLKGECRVASMLLAPFEPRVSREESALRLALEAQRFRVRWDFLAARGDAGPASPAGTPKLSA